jgi:hypothetical protein
LCPGGEAYDRLWSKLVSSAARVVAATLPEVLAEQAKHKAPPNSSFEVRAARADGEGNQAAARGAGRA